MTASVGVAVHTGGDEAPDELLADADVAMYDAKDAGRNRVTVYRPELGARARMEARLAWSTRIREALDQDGFELYAQPIEALAPDVGERRFEILLRLPQPDGSIAMPADFLPVAERHGLIREIDRWVVAKAAEIAARHTRRGRSAAARGQPLRPVDGRLRSSRPTSPTCSPPAARRRGR